MYQWSYEIVNMVGENILFWLGTVEELWAPKDTKARLMIKRRSQH
jgi:hypothetical protein